MYVNTHSLNMYWSAQVPGTALSDMQANKIPNIPTLIKLTFFGEASESNQMVNN